MGKWEVFADVLTAGGYSATKATGEYAVSIFAAERDSDTRKAADSPQSSSGSVQTATCCKRYEMENDFVLDTTTGKIWKYNQRKNAFYQIPRKRSQVSYDLYENEAQDLVKTLTNGIKVKTKGMSSTQAQALKKKLTNELIKPILDHLKWIKP